jgi:hypothetical protein
MSDITIPLAAERPLFKVAGTATIKHLNVRKEGPDEEKILAVDVKLEIKKVDRHLCGYFDDALEAFLWRGDTDALIARNPYLAPVSYANAITGATFTIGLHTFHGCDVKKFSLAPADGGVFTLGCAVTVYPSAGDVSDLAKIVQDDELVAIEGPPDLFAVSDAGQGDATVVVTLHGAGEPDPLLADALALVKAHGKPSISLVQRSLKIGYNRAARLIEEMERAGSISPAGANGQRSLAGGA